MKRIVLTLLFLLATKTYGVEENNAVGDLLASTYDPGILPSLGSSSPLNVSVSLIIANLLAVSDSDQTIDVDVYLLLSWIDTRLNTSLVQDNVVIVTDATMIKRFWTPDVYVQNSVTASIVDVLGPLAQLSIDANQRLFNLRRLSVKLGCKFNLQNYPHDVQYCPMIISPCE